MAAGGTNSPANLVTACAPCNSGKAAIDLDVINAPEMTAGSWQLREDPVFRLAFTLIARYLVAHYQSGPLDEDEANEVARCVHVHGYWSVETFARLMLDGSDHGDRSFIIRLGKEIDDFDRWNAEWQAAYALRNAAVAGVG